ncbi:MAG: insulinase family protein [Burkholderiales bacterium]|nr:insulinase family protein [Burkholderiales bacterium]
MPRTDFIKSPSAHALRAVVALALLGVVHGVRAEAFETVLPNGLKIIVKEDRRAPTVAHMVWYRAGSIDEVNGTTGVAHVLEHMMFKGTRRLGPGEFSRRVAAAGGRENAFTSRDYTAYFQQVHKSRLELVMQLEADRMANLRFSDAEFAKEIKVVMEERRLRTDDQPRALLHETLMAAAYKASPYRTPVIGWMRDLETMTAADARAWYGAWYAPNNAVLIVTGDASPETVVRLARKHYGPVRARPLPARKAQDEPPQAGIRRVEVKAPAELPHVSLAWRAPRLVDVEKDADVHALEVLAGVLDGHDGARLTRSLVRGSRVASHAGAGYDSTARGPVLFVLEGTPAAGRSAAEVEEALRAEVRRIAADGVSEAELRRVKAQVVAAQVFKRDSIFGQAMEIAQFEMSGLSHRQIDRALDKIRAVTAEEVKAVAARYFGDDTLTVATLRPLPLTDRPPPAPRGFRH